MCASIFDSVSLADDYSSLLQTTYGGILFLSGGVYKIEGSIAVLILNVIFIVMFAVFNAVC